MICRVCNEEVTTLNFSHYIKIASAVFSIGCGLCQVALGAVSLHKELNVDTIEETTTETKEES